VLLLVLALHDGEGVHEVAHRIAGRGEGGEPFVLEVEIQEGVTRGASVETVAEALPEEGGLAAAPHADDGQRLALDAGQVDVPAGMRRHRRGERIGDLLPDEPLRFSLHEGRVHRLLPFLEG